MAEVTTPVQAGAHLSRHLPAILRSPSCAGTTFSQCLLRVYSPWLVSPQPLCLVPPPAPGLCTEPRGPKHIRVPSRGVFTPIPDRTDRGFTPLTARTDRGFIPIPAHTDGGSIPITDRTDLGVHPPY